MRVVSARDLIREEIQTLISEELDTALYTGRLNSLTYAKVVRCLIELEVEINAMLTAKIIDRGLVSENIVVAFAAPSSGGWKWGSVPFDVGGSPDVYPTVEAALKNAASTLGFDLLET